jgi:hypothetical protein
MIHAGHRELCLIKNISPGGVQIQVRRKLQKGEQVFVGLQDFAWSIGEVMWVQGRSAGVSFADEIDVAEALSPRLPCADWVPRPPRLQVDLPVMVRAGSQTYFGASCNISQRGAKLLLEAPALPLSDVMVTIDGLAPRPATIRWQQDGKCGARFNSLIPIDEVPAEGAF